MLTPDELKKLAEFCGHKFALVNTCPCIWDEKLERWQDWHPDTSIEQAFMVADKIPNGERESYVVHLCHELGLSTKHINHHNGLEAIYFLIHANAEQRCAAALATQKEKLDAT